MSKITFIINGGAPDYTVSVIGYIGDPWIFVEDGEYTIEGNFDDCFTLMIEDSEGCVAYASDCCAVIDWNAEFVSPSCEQTWQCDLEYNILEISFLTTTTTTTCLRPSPLPNYYIMREINYSDSTVVNIQNMTVQDACDALTLKCNDPLSNANGYTGGAGEIAQYPPELGDIVYKQWDKTNCFTFDDGTYILTTDLFGWRCENDKYIGHIEDGIITDLILCSVPTTTSTTTIKPTTTTTTTCDPLLCDYGLLYNWYAVDTGKLAPTDWHVPSDVEWTTLTTWLTNNGYGYEGSGDDIAKSVASQCGWDVYSTPGTVGNNPLSNNSSGFSALPGGYRNYDGSFFGIGYYDYWWSSTKRSTSNAWYREMGYSHTLVGRYSGTKEVGFSIRCVRNSYVGWQNDVPVVDYDGNEYDVVEIGTQLWLVQNLKVTHYNDGETIPNVEDDTAWAALTTGACCAYNNDWETYACVPEPTTTTTTTVAPTTTTTTSSSTTTTSTTVEPTTTTTTTIEPTTTTTTTP